MLISQASVTSSTSLSKVGGLIFQNYPCNSTFHFFISFLFEIFLESASVCALLLLLHCVWLPSVLFSPCFWHSPSVWVPRSWLGWSVQWFCLLERHFKLLLSHPKISRYRLVVATTTPPKILGISKILGPPARLAIRVLTRPVVIEPSHHHDDILLP